MVLLLVGMMGQSFDYGLALEISGLGLGLGLEISGLGLGLGLAKTVLFTSLLRGLEPLLLTSKQCDCSDRILELVKQCSYSVLYGVGLCWGDGSVAHPHGWGSGG